MAKRRLNKKVALVGSAVFAVVVVVFILAVLHLSRDPEKFIEDGDAAVRAAREAVDEQVREKEYKRAEGNYGKARSLAKTDPLRIKILFKLVDVYLETDQWPKVLWCWNEIINIDPRNVKARYGRLEYSYIMADNGVRQLWQDVRQQASEFIELAENANLLMEDTAKWETFGIHEETGGQRLGPYLYLLKGRSALEMARLRTVTDPDKSLAQAVDDLEKVRELEPGNVDAFWYLAQAAIKKGDNLAEKGYLEEKDKAVEQAKRLLEQAIKVGGADPRAHVNLLKLKLMLAQRGGREQLQSLEPECLSLVRKFPSSAEAFSTISRLYSDPRLGPENLDKAIQAAAKAMELDEENVAYPIRMANLCYHKFSIYGQKDELYEAIEVAKDALTLPDAQEGRGPRRWTNRKNRASLYLFLANCYIEQVLEPCEVRTESQTRVWLTDAEQVVHEIEQIFGSGEEPQVIKWRGMLELAKGNTNLAVKKMYAAYEQLKVSGRPDAQLSYALAKVFKDTSEVGVLGEFLVSALNAKIGWTKPEVRLDYVETLLKLRAWALAISNINYFDEMWGGNKRSRILRIKALIGAKQFDEAQAELANLQPDDPDSVKLSLALVQAKIRHLQMAIAQKRVQEGSSIIFKRAKLGEKEPVDLQADIQFMMEELNNYRQLEAKLVEQLLPIEPNAVEQASITNVCQYYIDQKRTSEARDLVNRFLRYFPNNTAGLISKQLLSEPNPGEISQRRATEIREQVLSNIAAPIRRAVELGIFYRRNSELEKAVRELKKALKLGISQKRLERPALGQIERRDSYSLTAASHIFDIAIETGDLEQAEQIAETAQRENLDNCEGQLFTARLAMAKTDFKDALTKVNECLAQRPVFSHAYMLRSSVNAALGNEHASITDIRKAAFLNPLDGTIAKALASVLYRRNQKLGDNVSSDQITETGRALEKAIASNPGDFQLLNFYADYITPTEPLKALAIRQSLQKTVPTMQNAIRLGRLATEMALKERGVGRKEALFDIAHFSYEQARQIDPRNKEMLYYYEEYFRARGQPEKAKALIQESEDEKLLWYHYFQRGQFEEAKRILERLYKSDAKDSTVVKGLLLVAEKTRDKETVKKYSEELLVLEGSVENRLTQIQTFLKVGLVKEAEYKLQSFKEKYPDEPRALLLEAWLVMRQGRLEKALELTNQSLASNQNDAAAWQLRGQIYLFMSNYDRAISDFKRSKSLVDEPNTRIALAKTYLRMDREDDAITELKNIIDVPGAPLEARTLLEQIYLRLGRKETLRRFYDDTLEKFPDNVLWYNRAAGFAIADGEFDRAEQLYRKAYLMKRQVYLEQGMEDGMQDVQYAIAFDGYLRALVLGAGTPDAANWNPEKLDKVFEESRKYVDRPFAPLAFFRMAEAKLKLGDKTTAVEYCRKAVDKAGTNEVLASEILLRMFLLLGAEEGAEEVSKYCKQRLETNPDSLAANYTMFNLARINEEYSKAVDYLDKCVELIEPDSPRRVEYVMRKAEVLTLAYERKSDNDYLKRAIAVYESLLAKMPNNTNVLNNLAYMLAQNNERFSEALRYTKQAHETRPNNPGYMDTYAYVLHKMGKNSQAVELLVRALQQYEQDNVVAPPDVYEHLGMVREKLGAKMQALAAYKQALETGAGKLSEAARQRITSAIERVLK